MAGLRGTGSGGSTSSVWSLFRLWLPTVFGASMLVVEIPVVAAGAARSTDGGRALAAIGIGMSILVVVNTPALAITALVAGEQGRRSAIRLRRYTVTVGVFGTLVLLGLATPPGSAAIDAVFDLDPHLGHAVSAFLVGLALNSLGVAVRRYQHGRLIHHRHTGPIVWATVVRLAVTAAIAWIGVALRPGQGPLIAGCALTAGAFLEAAALHIAARRLPASVALEGGSWTSLVEHHGHLSAARLLVMVPTLITTVGVAHAANAAASLIVWPVLMEFAALFTSPTTDWESVAATALRDSPGNSAPQRLTVWLAAAITGLFAAAYVGGLADVFVRDLLAVPRGAAELGLRWLWLLLPLPALWVSRAYLRGVVMADDNARWLSYAGLGHILVLGGALTALTRSGLPGVACAGIALTAGIVTETIVTGYGPRAFRQELSPAGMGAP
jgi:hypothetical protein